MRARINPMGFAVMAIGLGLLFVLPRQRVMADGTNSAINLALSLLTVSLLGAGYAVLAKWRTTHVLLAATALPAVVLVVALLQNAAR